MKIEVSDLGPIKKTMAVEVEPAVVERETEDVVRRYAGQARIPGFRPGKAPLSVIRTRYGKEIADDVRDRLLARLYAEATKEKGLRPVGDPSLDEVTFEPGAPFSFKTTFEVMPVLAPRDYKGVTVRKPRAVVEEAEVDGALEDLRQSMARLVTEEGKAAETGDVLIADVDAEPEGHEPFRRERVMIEVGSTDHAPEFNEKVLGATAGAALDFTLTSERPAPGHEGHAHGNSVRYRIAVHEVKRKMLPALDDDLARDLGEFADLAALRERVRSDLAERKEAGARRAVRQAVLDKVLLENVVPLPEVLVEDEVRHRLEDLVRSMILQGMDPEKADIDWARMRSAQEEPARKTVHARLVLDAVAREEGLDVAPEEVDAVVRREAERMGEKADAVRSRLRKGGGLEALRDQLLREKSLDFLTSVANIQDEE